MGLKSWIKSWAGGGARPGGVSWITPNLGAGLTSPYAQNAWVNAGIRSKMNLLGSVPGRVMRGSQDAKDEGKPLPDTDPWAKLFARPTPKMDGTFFMQAALAFTDLEGEFFAVKFADGSRFAARGDVVRELVMVHPRNVTATLDYARDVVTSWDVQANGKLWTVPAESMWHFRTFNPDDKHRGLSPLRAAFVGMEGDHRTAQFVRSSVENGAIPSGYVTLPVGTQAPEISALRDAWEKRHGGAQNAARTAFLTGGMTYTPVGQTSKDLGLQSSREWSRDEVMAVLGVSEYDFGQIQDGNLASMRVAERATWTRSVIPWMTAVESSMDAEFFADMSGREDLWYSWDLTGVEALQISLGDKLDNAAKLSSLGYSANDINEALGLGMPEIEEAPEHEVPDPEPVAKALTTDEEKILADGVASAFRVMLRIVKTNLALMNPTDFDKSAKAVNPLAQLVSDRMRWKTTMRNQVRPAIEKVGRIVARDTGIEFQASVNWDSPKFRKSAAKRTAQMVDLAPKYRKKLATRINSVIARNGFDVRAVEEMIDKEFGNYIGGNAETIARTEVGMLREGIRLTVAKDNGYRSKVWQSVQDGKERASHDAVHGERVGIDDRFSNGLAYPLEVGAAPEEVINCRCKARYQKRKP